ncbi:hypothetical protein SAMN03097708_03161 [Thiohalomonas denitrificans]|uniref:Uncharacterized protein n=2 Tax=Thiohalomonas denitrificans TaxID=415747 RepID=A0A1G5R0J8_9GAMM|nr:hypothetical protein SAMN03097708_03161 [Thiohalomonas denitrificans]
MILAFPFFWSGDFLSWFFAMIAYVFFLVQKPERRLVRSLVITSLLIGAIAFMELDQGQGERSNSVLQPTSGRYAAFHS